MKKFIALFLLLSMVALASCAAKNDDVVPDATDTADTTDDTTKADETTASPEETTGTEDTTPVELNVNIDSYYLTDISEKNIVCIKTPPLKASDSGSVTNTIYDYIRSQISFVYYPLEEFELTKVSELSADFTAKRDNGEYTECLLELEGETKYNKSDLLSVVYKGMYNYKTSAHPTNMCFSINLNSAMDRVYFRDIYNINEELYDLFKSYAQIEVDRAFAGERLSVEDMLCTKDVFIQGIETEILVKFYMTDNSVGFIYSVPHAVGDYLTVEIPLSEMEEFKK